MSISAASLKKFGLALLVVAALLVLAGFTSGWVFFTHFDWVADHLAPEIQDEQWAVAITRAGMIILGTFVVAGVFATMGFFLLEWSRRKNEAGRSTDD